MEMFKLFWYYARVCCLYVTQDGGHSWPGADQTLVGDPPSKYINATDLMWSFFQQYSLDCDPRTDINTATLTTPD